ncbi:MAG: hypothetical protein LCH76_15110 [Actinobacteria bacterium]|nr:hypothetical protein [Actinomycetota bacterium]
MDREPHEQALRQLGVRNADRLGDRWADHGISAQEMLAWLAAGVHVDEPHLAAALAAAEWTPQQAARLATHESNITVIDAVRQHPNAATYARELRAI